MKIILATLAAAAVLAPAALADGGTPAPSGTTAAAVCKAVRKGDAAAWSAFAASYKIVGKADFAAAFGKSAKNGKTPLGKCTSWVAKQMAAAKKAAQTTTTTTTSATTTPAAPDASSREWCKAELAKPSPAYKSLGDCLKEKAGR